MQRALGGLRRLLPAFPPLRVAASWAGYIDATPDLIPVLGEVPSPRGFVFATGFSPHRFGMGPIAGRLVSEPIVDGRTSLTIEAFPFSRFVKGDIGKICPTPGVLTLDVEPRKPRLAWQGTERKEMAGAVPTQGVEIVRPGRAVERKGELDLSARPAAARDELVRPENRLIGTNDSLVALQTLLEGSDLETKDWRNRDTVDLVYIDPP